MWGCKDLSINVHPRPIYNLCNCLLERVQNVGELLAVCSDDVATTVNNGKVRKLGGKYIGGMIGVK